MSATFLIPKGELDAIAERLRNASSRPWRVESDPERLGENWHLFSCGNSGEDGKDYYVTTDHVHASEYDGDAKTDAEFIVWCRNDMARIGNAYIALRERYDEIMAAMRTLRDADAWGAGEKVVAQALATLEAIAERDLMEATP